MMSCSVPAVGSRRKSPGRELREQKRIVIAFDDATFDQIRSLALQKKTSFSQQVRELVEFGLLDLADEGGL